MESASDRQTLATSSLAGEEGVVLRLPRVVGEPHEARGLAPDPHGLRRDALASGRILPAGPKVSTFRLETTVAEAIAIRPGEKRRILQVVDA